MSKVSDVEEGVHKGMLVYSEPFDEKLDGVMLKKYVAFMYYKKWYLGRLVKYRNEHGEFNVDAAGFFYWSRKVKQEKQKYLSQIPEGEYLVDLIFKDGEFETVSPMIASEGADNFASLVGTTCCFLSCSKQ